MCSLYGKAQDKKKGETPLGARFLPYAVLRLSYLAKATERVSRMTVIFTCPG